MIRAQLNRLAGRSFCVSFARSDDVVPCHEIGQSVMLDNGAYTLWRQGRHPDWDAYHAFAGRWLEHRTTWAVIPDVIDGTEQQNDRLIAAWPHGARGAPVWHLNEPVDRLIRLAADWPRVCLGSSGEYARVGSPAWRGRMDHAMNRLCGDGPPPTWLHMLRGLSLAGSHYPFASADSTNIGQNFKGSASRPARDIRAMADRLDARQCPARWHQVPEPLILQSA